MSVIQNHTSAQHAEYDYLRYKIGNQTILRDFKYPSPPSPPPPTFHSQEGYPWEVSGFLLDKNKIHLVTITDAPSPSPINKKVWLFARSCPRKNERFTSYFGKIPPVIERRYHSYLINFLCQIQETASIFSSIPYLTTFK